MNAYLTLQNSPRVKLAVKLGASWKQIDCLIDTGFSSGLILNQSHFPKPKTTPSVGKQEFELADGSLVAFDMYLLTVRYQKQKKRLLTVFNGGSDNLVGIRFLEDLVFTLDLKNKKVSLIT